NYFMLNTIARWDKPSVNSDRDAAGSLVTKAGIRSDWTKTRSPFCYRKTASGAFAELIDAIDAAVLVVSYSASGIIVPEEMADLLAPQGDLTLHGTNYAAYRGGRQSLTRASSGHELVFVVRRRAMPVSSGPGDGRARGAAAIARQLAEWEVHGLLRSRFVPARLLNEFSARPGGICLTESLFIPTVDFYRLDDHEAELSSLSDADLRDVAQRLKRARCADHGEEFRTLLSLIRSGDKGNVDRSYHQRLLLCLRRYAHRKYRDQFWESVAELQVEIDKRPADFSSISSGLSRIVEQARARFGE
ncbi:MAG: adenine methyltransferase, partial [Spirochaetaceae bacterium]|nr:adenine methyltransferase [Spirochaetaceae bacterium]